MKEWKAICSRFLFPPLWLVIILTVFSTVELVAVFVEGWEAAPIAYIVYVFSFYTLIVICFACWKIIPGYYKSIKGKVYDNKYANRYLTDVAFKTHVNLYRSLIINLIYVMAMYTFYIITTAIIDMVKYRKYNSPVMSISKIIKLASALFSMLFLETAMFSQFGEENSLEMQRIMIMATGAGISVIVVAMAVYIIIRSTKEIKKLEE